jgi:hypothetical protein
MDSYIGTKVVFARPMTREDAEKHLDRIIRSGKVTECGEDEGYLVLYKNGYQSWSPSDAFGETYRRTDGMSFGFAIEAIKEGHFVAFCGWKEADQFIYFVEGTTVPIENLRGNCAKAIDASANTAPVQDICGHIDMKAADGSIIVGRSPSQREMLTDGWYIVGKSGLS